MGLLAILYLLYKGDIVDIGICLYVNTFFEEIPIPDISCPDS